MRHRVYRWVVNHVALNHDLAQYGYVALVLVALQGVWPFLVRGKSPHERPPQERTAVLDVTPRLPRGERL